MAVICEQVDIYGNVRNDFDEKINAKDVLFDFICAQIKNDSMAKVIKTNKYISLEIQGKKFVFLVAQITYLGNSAKEDRSFKKRIQIKKSWKEITLDQKNDVDVRWLGVYVYRENLIIVDFVKDTYMNRKLNNSSAHVYTNDFFQAMNRFKFKRVDKNSNSIYVIRAKNFIDYLLNTSSSLDSTEELFCALNLLNENFPFKKDLYGDECFREMQKSNYKNTIQTKWNGFYLEFIFEKLLKKCNIDKNLLKFVENGKKYNYMDIDLFSLKYDLYADLKASNIDKVETPGNDKETIVKLLEEYGKFWYIIYQHETVYDKDLDGRVFEEWEKIRFERGKTKPSSGKQKKQMLGMINFQNMLVLEVNKANCRNILKDFNQGINSNGKERKVKFTIDKKNIENFVIYRW